MKIQDRALGGDCHAEGTEIQRSELEQAWCVANSKQTSAARVGKQKAEWKELKLKR